MIGTPLRWTAALTVGAALVSCSKKEPAEARPAAKVDEPATAEPFASPTVAQLFMQGRPTFVTGTAGDERSDHSIAAQIALIRAMAVPESDVVADSDVLTGGASSWPAVPIVYGGPHVNQLMAAIGPELPFELAAGRLAIGDKTFDGDEYLLIAAVPARAAGDAVTRHPAFVLYAGTGTPGIGEINAVGRGQDAILVADRFGPLWRGRWTRSASGVSVEWLGEPTRRLEWRAVEREGATIHFVAGDAPPEREAEIIEATMRGLKRAATALRIGQPAHVQIYFYPDAGTKRSITGNGGDGHAVVTARTLHMILPKSLDALESLVAHEGTHVLGYEAWGQPGSALIAEGLAVWASGSYGGKSYRDLRSVVPSPRPPVATLLGGGFRKLPEQQGYVLGAFTIEAAIDLVGIEGLRDHLFPATVWTWNESCERAGTEPAAIERALDRALAR